MEHLEMINLTKIRIIHTADCHLGITPALPSSKRKVRRKKLRENFTKICRYAIEKQADLLLIAGDLFDNINPSNSLRKFVVKWLKKCYEAGIEIVLIGGNHDMPRSTRESNSPLSVIEASGFAHFLSNPVKITSVTLDIKGIKVNISGLSYNHLASEDYNPLHEQSVPIEGDINIFMSHCFINILPSLEGEYTFDVNRIPPKIDYAAFGHYHKANVRRLKGNSWICVPGVIDILLIEKTPSICGFYEVEIDSDNGCEEPIFHELPTTKTKLIEVPLSLNVKNIKKHIIDHIPDDLPIDGLIKVRLTGTINLEYLDSYQKYSILEDMNNKFFLFVIEDNHEDLKWINPSRNIVIEKDMKPLKVLKNYFDELISQTEKSNFDMLNFLTNVKEKTIETYLEFKKEI